MKRSLTFGLAALLTLSSTAYADNYYRDNVIELTAGVGTTAKLPSSIEAVIAVNAVGLINDSEKKGRGFVVARIHAEMAAKGGIPYIDFEFEGLGYQFTVDDAQGDSFISATLLNLELQRNLAVNNEAMLRLSFVGLRAHIEHGPDEVGPELRFILNGALDVLGLSYTKRLSDGSDLDGVGIGFQAELGVDFYERFRILFGSELNVSLNSYYKAHLGTKCASPDDGQRALRCCPDDIHCDPWNPTRWADVRSNVSAYLDLMASLTENLSIFGRAAYHVYEVTDHLGNTPWSTDKNFRFTIGASYGF